MKSAPAVRPAASLLALVLGLGWAADAKAQEAIGGESPLRGEAARSVPQVPPPQPEDPPESVPQAVPALEYLPQHRRSWQINPRMSTAWQYDNNVFLDEVDEVTAHAWSVRPGIHVRRGEDPEPLQLNLDYQADLTFYDGVSGMDSDSHFLFASLVHQMAKLRTALSGQVLRYTGGDFEAGGQTERLQFLPALDIGYAISPKTTVGIYGNILHSDYEDRSYHDYERYRIGVYADYQLSEKTRLGLQANQIWEYVENTGDQTAQEILLRMDYGRDSKLSVYGNLGVEIRHPADADSEASPVGRFTVAYSPWQTFRLAAEVYRIATPSVYLDGQYFYATGVMLHASQRVLTRFTLGIDWGVEHTSYDSALASVSSDREDDITLLRPWLRYSFNDWASLELFYQYTNNDSTGDDAQPFTRDQAGVGLNMAW